MGIAVFFSGSWLQSKLKVDLKFWLGAPAGTKGPFLLFHLPSPRFLTVGLTVGLSTKAFINSGSTAVEINVKDETSFL